MTLDHRRNPHYSPERAAAFHILRSRLFAEDVRVQSHVRGDLIDFDAMLMQDFSSSQRRLLELADSLLRQQRALNVGRAFSFWDPEQSDIAFEALRLFTRREPRGS